MIKKSLDITPGIEPLYGTRDENLRLMEDGLQVQIDLRSDAIHITGPLEGVERWNASFLIMKACASRGGAAERRIEGNAEAGDRRPHGDAEVAGGFGQAAVGRGEADGAAASPNQRKYVEAIEQGDMVFGLGPAGTGKTYLAVAMAVSALMAKKVSRIILVRPAVEAGERLGFLPGSLQEKVDPICGRCTTRCTTCWTRTRWTSCWSGM